ncbi:MAG: hypothetical protein KC454_09840 [Flavobacteriales bacterium]|nr:hypothetical protein [Flavobacteriales bacterium]
MDYTETNEVCILLKVLTHVELQLSVIEDIRRFTDNLIEDTSSKEMPYLVQFYKGYANYTNDVIKNETFLLEKKAELEQQIKSRCVHDYIEDYVDCMGYDDVSCCKITYCNKCNMTF